MATTTPSDRVDRASWARDIAYLVLKGVAYGITHIVPGLGGGLILILMRIYEPFVDHIGNFFVDLRRWKEHLAFLIPLGVGMVIGLIGLAKIITVALDHYPAASMVFFMGLLLGTIPAVLKMHPDMRPTAGRIASLVLGLGLVAAIRTIRPAGASDSTLAELNSGSGLLYNLLVSTLAGGASVTPGLDGSYILLLGGTYDANLEAVSQLTHLVVHWGVLITTAVGAAGGILGCSKLIHTAIKKVPSLSYYFILGLILGSVYGLWPRTQANVGPVILALAFLVGLIVALYFSRTPEDASA